MRALLLALLLLAAPAARAQPAQITGSSGGMVAGDSQTVVFLNTFTGAGYWTFPRGQWVRVDLKPFGVPADATAAFLHGTLVITMAAAPDDGMVQVHLRRPGETAACDVGPFYTTVHGVPSGGARAPFADLVPLKDGAFEVCIRTLWGSRNNGVPLAPWEASFNAAPAFGVNIRLRGWLR